MSDTNVWDVLRDILALFKNRYFLLFVAVLLIGLGMMNTEIVKIMADQTVKIIRSLKGQL